MLMDLSDSFILIDRLNAYRGAQPYDPPVVRLIIDPPPNHTALETLKAEDAGQKFPVTHVGRHYNEPFPFLQNIFADGIGAPCLHEGGRFIAGQCCEPQKVDGRLKHMPHHPLADRFQLFGGLGLSISELQIFKDLRSLSCNKPETQAAGSSREGQGPAPRKDQQYSRPEAGQKIKRITIKLAFGHNPNTCQF